MTRISGELRNQDGSLSQWRPSEDFLIKCPALSEILKLFHALLFLEVSRKDSNSEVGTWSNKEELEWTTHTCLEYPPQFTNKFRPWSHLLQQQTPLKDLAILMFMNYFWRYKSVINSSKEIYVFPHTFTQDLISAQNLLQKHSLLHFRSGYVMLFPLSFSSLSQHWRHLSCSALANILLSSEDVTN